MSKKLLIAKVSLCAFALCLVVSGLKQNRVRRHIASDRTPQTADMRVFALTAAGLMKSALAGEAGDDTCNQAAGLGWAKVRAAGRDYSHGALQFFNSMFAMLNSGFPSETESALCHFHKSMSMNPDKSALPVTIEKVFGPQTIKLVVVVPTEDFAVAAGYDAKGTVTINDETFMVLYWGGTDDASKGFMIRGTPQMGDDDKKGANFIRWDRTGEDQIVDFWGAKFDDTYLEAFTADAEGSDMGKSRAFYGHTEYNKTTKAVLTYAVEIGPKRSGASSYGCYRIWAQGTYDDEMTIAKTDNSLNLTGESIAATYTDGTNMDAAQLVNSVDTANGTGNLTGGEFSSIVAPLITADPFGKSCADVANGAGAGQPFEGSESNFAATPDDVF